jgi:hypothetical protein
VEIVELDYDLNMSVNCVVNRVVVGEFNLLRESCRGWTFVFAPHAGTTYARHALLNAGAAAQHRCQWMDKQDSNVSLLLCKSTHML